MSKKDIALAVLAGLILLAGWILVFLVRWMFLSAQSSPGGNRGRDHT